MNKLKIIEMFRDLFKKKPFISSPVMIIKKDTEDTSAKEYKSIEEAIEDLAKDPNFSPDKIEKLKSSVNQLKNKTSIKIRNGEII